MKLTGSLVEAYIFCPRQAWLIAHQISGNQYNEFLEIGKLISGESYKREKKEILIDGGKIDFVKNREGKMVIVEVKKSDKFINTAKAQLLFYMLKLKEKGEKEIEGEIRIPESNKIIKIQFGEKEEKYVKEIIEKLENMIATDLIPDKINNITQCRKCAHFEFCWS